MKILYIILGSLSLGLAVLGIFLPLLPTTPLLLLAAALYLRSSQRLYSWLMNHPKLGPYIRNFQVYKAIPRRAKIVSVTMVWVTIGYCILFVLKPLWLRIAMGLLATGISWHILSFATLEDLHKKD